MDRVRFYTMQYNRAVELGHPKHIEDYKKKLEKAKLDVKKEKELKLLQRVLIGLLGLTIISPFLLYLVWG